VEGTHRAELPEYAAMAQMRFEIQIRTILQEAWAEIEHQLVYKGEGSAPDDIRRQITRVSALLEVADKEFQEVYARRNVYSQKLKTANISVLRDESVNVDSIIELIRRKYPWAEGWKTVDGELVVGKNLNELVSECRTLGLTRIDQLDRILDKWEDVARKESTQRYEAEVAGAPVPKQGTREYRSYTWSQAKKSYYFPTGFIRVSLQNEFPNTRVFDNPRT
jgi:hypothetical protein